MGTAAIRHNRPDIVEWLLAMGHEAFDTERISKTILEVAIEAYVPGDTRVLDHLAAYDMLGLRRGSRAPEQEIAWRPTRFPVISKLPDLPILRWLDQHVPDLVLDVSIMDEPVMRGDLEMIRYIHEHRQDGGCSMWAFQVAYSNNDRAVWRYLVENRPEPLWPPTLHGMITARDFESLRHLHRVRGARYLSGEPVIPSCCLVLATQLQDLEMVRVLRDELGAAIPSHAIV